VVTNILTTRSQPSPSISITWVSNAFIAAA
jgi:hypothetical protein